MGQMLGSAPLVVSGSGEGSIAIPIIVAIVALLATIIGAVIGAVTNYLIAVKRERSERENDRRKLATELTRAARLIDEELAGGARAVRMSIDLQDWRPEATKMSSRAWEKYSAIIAPEVSGEVWTKLVKAYVSLNFLNDLRSSYIREGNARTEVWDMKGKLTLDEIRNARQALNVLSCLDYDHAAEAD